MHVKHKHLIIEAILRCGTNLVSEYILLALGHWSYPLNLSKTSWFRREFGPFLAFNNM